jgi:NAD(P)-dependent dehydrogenase (short-subunit alcohol dehydrogenase family)
MAAIDQQPASLAGRVIVITGAGQGLGRAYATAAARHGATVIVNDVSVANAQQAVEDIRGSGGRAFSHCGDISEDGYAADLVGSALEHSGRLDGLINNAGLFKLGLPWEEDAAGARRQVEVNVLGAIFTGVAALRAMTQAGSGAIVNICSGAQSGYPNRATYCATKGAMASLTYAWAIDAGPFGVRVNGLCPVAGTAMSLASGAVPGSMSSPDAIAPLAVYLLSQLSAGLNGQLLRLDGEGLSVLSSPRIAATVTKADGWTLADIATALDSPELAKAVR